MGSTLDSADSLNTEDFPAKGKVVEPNLVLLPYGLLDDIIHVDLTRSLLSSCTPISALPPVILSGVALPFNTHAL